METNSSFVYNDGMSETTCNGKTQQDLYQLTRGFCRGCEICDGILCAGELPGWGGIENSQRFIENVLSWNRLEVEAASFLPEIGFAPVTGAVQNLGLSEEEPFYFLAAEAAHEAKISFCIGDGSPDIKLQSGIAAAKQLGIQADVFIKPYGQKQWLERAEWASEVADFVGIDIDSWQILTMAGQASMEKKSASQLKELKKSVKKPFVIKGICDRETVALVEEVKPEAAVISNHGGRVASPAVGTADLLNQYGAAVRRFTGSLWVDGGLRSEGHLRKAAALGAQRVLIGRPLIQGALLWGKEGMKRVLKQQYGYSRD